MSKTVVKMHFAKATLGAGRFVAWCGQTVPLERIIRPSADFKNEDSCRLCWQAMARARAARQRAERKAEESV